MNDSSQCKFLSVNAMKKVLIIDDDARICLTIKKNLERKGIYKVLTASDGKAGIRKARFRKPDIILMDIDMPKMNGLDAMAELNEKESTSLIPVIMLTGVDTMKAKSEAMYQYAEHYLLKPVTPDEIEHKIKDVLERRTNISGAHLDI